MKLANFADITFCIQIPSNSSKKDVLEQLEQVVGVLTENPEIPVYIGDSDSFFSDEQVYYGETAEGLLNRFYCNYDFET